jgi:hypothetical protein
MTVFTADPQKPIFEPATFEVFIKFSLDMARQATVCLTEMRLKIGPIALDELRTPKGQAQH